MVILGGNEWVYIESAKRQVRRGLYEQVQALRELGPVRQSRMTGTKDADQGFQRTRHRQGRQCMMNIRDLYEDAKHTLPPESPNPSRPVKEAFPRSDDPPIIVRSSNASQGAPRADS